MLCIAAGILLGCKIMCCWMVGFQHITKNIFYFLTFRWALKLIIKFRYKEQKVKPEEPEEDEEKKDKKKVRKDEDDHHHDDD